MSKERLDFTLVDLEHPHGGLDGRAWIENGQLLIRLNTHGNCSEESGPIIALQYDMEIARMLIFRDINSEEPTESLDLDGALEEKRKETP